jgi:hypothetical protein
MSTNTTPNFCDAPTHCVRRLRAPVGRGFTTFDGLDLSTDMMAEASRRNIYREFIVADLTTALPLADASYRAAICNIATLQVASTSKAIGSSDRSCSATANASVMIERECGRAIPSDRRGAPRTGRHQLTSRYVRVSLDADTSNTDSCPEARLSTHAASLEPRTGLRVNGPSTIDVLWPR